MVRLVVFLWLGAALLAASTGAFRRLPVPPPAIAITLTVATLLLLRLSSSARAAVQRLGPGPLVIFHLTRIAAGTYFLVLGARGLLPREFTTAAGWGDIIVGVAAIGVLAWCLPIYSARQRAMFIAWNVAGLLDILGVLANALRIFLRDPSFVEPFTVLPLAILPAFVVPIVIVSHVLLFGWSARMNRR